MEKSIKNKIMKKGFTLVELLAVIAILAILVIFVVPKIIQTYKNAQIKSFITQAQSIYKMAEEQHLSDNFKNQKNNIYCHSENTDLNKLPSSNNEVYYHIIFNENNKIKGFQITDNKRSLTLDLDSVIKIESLRSELIDPETIMSTDINCNSNRLASKGDISIISMTLDGEVINSLPSNGAYRIDSYECSNKESVTWYNPTQTLSITPMNTTPAKCTVNFVSGAYLAQIANQGDYVNYKGNNGCTGDQCSGKSVSCYAGANKGPTDGWRVAYVDDNDTPTNYSDDSVYITTAGSPECYTNSCLQRYACQSNYSGYTSYNNGYCKDGRKDTTMLDLSTSCTDTTQDYTDSKAITYCHSSYAYNNTCNSASSWNLNSSDFSKIMFTQGYTGKTLENCRHENTASCGTDNEIIGNAGYYWFAGTVCGYYKTSSTSAYWYYNEYRSCSWMGKVNVQSNNKTIGRILNTPSGINGAYAALIGGYAWSNTDSTSAHITADSYTNTHTYGIRPVIRLYTGMIADGGSGTLGSPYELVPKNN